MSDKKEWDETLDLILEGHETISSDLSIGSFVTIKEELFKEMIKEINTSRVKLQMGESGEVDLIVVEESDDDKS